MRCKNCGWENPDETTKCEKCHANLSDAFSAHNPTSPVSDRMRSTVAEGVIFNDQTPQTTSTLCPKCGYPVSDGFTTCPNCNHELQSTPTVKQLTKCASCGSDIDAEVKFCPNCGTPTREDNSRHHHIQRSGMGTVIGGPVFGSNPSNKFCTLKPIAWEGENVNYNPVTYSGDTIILNRANTDANNNTITSREQAVLTSENGEWFIENRSDLRTTFIRVNGKVKLNSGDIIVLGNREFEFKG